MKGGMFPVDFTVYLPDEIGAQAKEFERGVLSRLLRDAVTDELGRRKAMAEAQGATKVHEVYVEDEDGRGFTGRITGAEIAYNDRNDVTVYVTDDERVIVHDADRARYEVLDNPAEQLRHWLTDGLYVEAMHALGEKPVVDL
jgi:hypothetical protein